MITNKQIAQRVRERCGDKIVVVLVPMKRIEFDETYTTWLQSFVVKQNLIQRVNKDYHIIAPLTASLRQVIGTFLPHNIHYYSENNNRLHVDFEISKIYQLYKNQDDFLYIKYLYT